MSDKLDPELLRLARAPSDSAESEGSVRVMIALARSPDAQDLARLRACGLAAGSAVGDVITGTVAVAALDRLAADPLVVKIEGSRPLEPEAP